MGVWLTVPRGENERGWLTKVAQGIPFLRQNECDSSPFDLPSILMKGHFLGTAKIAWKHKKTFWSVQRDPWYLKNWYSNKQV